MLSHVVCDGDHPRACGEHVVTFAPMVKSAGSSPRMRGTLNPATPEVDQTGIIPAHAGNTQCIRLPRMERRDHPRACGEHVDGASHDVGAEGSSPRMRGTPFPHLRFVVPVGIIPAHAGNTSRPCMMPSLVQDHPRACGEHPYHALACSLRRGSSPRMRGTRGHVRSNGEVGGIIPAHAGNTQSGHARGRSDGDHPRACGEHEHMTNEANGFRGSSPRMRGTLFRNRDDAIRHGIIPAHAGNTTFVALSAPTGRDHPRACGEHALAMTAFWALSGSSPRMRGTLQVD